MQGNAMNDEIGLVKLKYWGGVNRTDRQTEYLDSSCRVLRAVHRFQATLITASLNFRPSTGSKHGQEGVPMVGQSICSG